MINTIFDYCVYILQALALFLGVTYKTVNVWIFCFAWPALTFVLACGWMLERKSRRRSVTQVRRII